MLDDHGNAVARRAGLPEQGVVGQLLHGFLAEQLVVGELLADAGEVGRHGVVVSF